MSATITSGVRGLRNSIFLSFLAHALFGLACFLLLQAQQKASRPPRVVTYVQVEPLPAAKTKNPAKSDEREDRSKNMKVVQSDAGRLTDKAAPDSFLGEKTRVVDRQTVSANKMTVMGQSKPAAPRTARAQTQEKARAREKMASSADPALEKAKPLAKFGLAILPEARRKGATEELSKDEPQWANIGSQPQDYVDGIKQSDRTALNTREYAYFGYHQRIRKRLEMEWTRLLRDTLIKFYRNGRHLASDTEHTTKVLVVLNPQGEITRVKIVGMSGTQELDDVAVQAFNKAGPFPNPPRGLIKNGEIEVPWELRLRS